MQKFIKDSRYLPDTAFQKYIGKPAFAQYGVGNTDPTVGGINYGEYMMSHNINPHRLSNNPMHPQVYENVEKEYQKKKIDTKEKSANLENDPAFKDKIRTKKYQRLKEKTK